MGNVIYIRHRRPPRDYTEPFADMNITPLIDVMLVLLVMFIIVIPVATHKIPVDLPKVGTTFAKPQIQKLTLLKSGQTLWNGMAVENDALDRMLRASAAADDQLQLQSEDDARYENFALLIARVKRSGISKLGFVGMGRHREFGK